MSSLNAIEKCIIIIKSKTGERISLGRKGQQRCFELSELFELVAVWVKRPRLHKRNKTPLMRTHVDLSLIITSVLAA